MYVTAMFVENPKTDRMKTCEGTFGSGRQRAKLSAQYGKG